jgi:hypothetical protein
LGRSWKGSVVGNDGRRAMGRRPNLRTLVPILEQHTLGNGKFYFFFRMGDIILRVDPFGMVTILLVDKNIWRNLWI